MGVVYVCVSMCVHRECVCVFVYLFVLLHYVCEETCGAGEGKGERGALEAKRGQRRARQKSRNSKIRCCKLVEEIFVQAHVCVCVCA